MKKKLSMKIFNFRFLILNLRNRQGFSLIELMIVVALFALVVVVVATSYLSFESSQKLKSAALQLKSDIRLTQSNAQAGNKGPGSCATTSSLVGWYIKVTNTNSTYDIGGSCQSGSTSPYSSSGFSSSTTNLPQGVTINAISYNGTAISSSASMLFTPLSYQANFFDESASSIAPNFTDNSASSRGVLKTTGSLTGGNFTIVITLSLSSNLYYVKVNSSSGQVWESTTN